LDLPFAVRNTIESRQSFFVVRGFGEPPVEEYTIAILRSKAADSGVAVRATTVRSGDRLILSVRLDLSKVAPGPYLLRTRLGSGDQIYFYPLTIK
jgi:hypothetical protein